MTCCQNARYTTHLVAWTGGDYSYDDFHVLLGRTYTLLALGLCYWSIFVLITEVKDNQDCGVFLLEKSK